MSECTLGKNKPHRDGYSYESRDGIRMGEHRWAYIDAFGEIPPNMLICHTCDNKYCRNPDHLFLGANADNQADKKNKGRASKGENRHNAVLTESQVIEIRESPKSQRELARIYEVNPSTIRRVRNFQTWKHVTS